MKARDVSPVPGRRRSRRFLFFLAGSLALALAALGVVLPVLPTTPFLIVAAFCYARSSERVHAWLLGNRVFGRQLAGYLAGRGLSWRVKAGTLAFLWVMLGLSAMVFVPILWVRVMLVVIGLAVTVHIAKLKTKSQGARYPGADEEEHTHE